MGSLMVGALLIGMRGLESRTRLKRCWAAAGNVRPFLDVTQTQPCPWKETT